MNTYKKYLTLTVVALLFQTYQLHSYPLVYSMKIRRSFGTDLFAALNLKNLVLFTGLPLYYWRDRKIIVPSLEQNIHEKLTAAGAIFNLYAMTQHHWWAELTTGLETQKVKAEGTSNFKNSKTGWDDIILTIGKNFFTDSKTQIATYVLAGFPIGKTVTPLESLGVLVGSRLFGLGAGAEFSYAFMQSAERSFIGLLQARFVHFFSRSWFPILPIDARLQPGNMTDLFLIAQYRVKKNIVEIGYNPTFFTNQAALFKEGKVVNPNFSRNSFYANYTHLLPHFPVLNIPGALGLGMSVSKANLFDAKSASVWFNMTFLF